MMNFSMVVSGSAAITYLLDTHRENALHVLAFTNFAKNMVLYGSTFFANGMILDRGVKVSLLILGACQAFCWLASIPMYIFGKRVRAFVSRFLAFVDGLQLTTVKLRRLHAIPRCSALTNHRENPRQLEKEAVEEGPLGAVVTTL